MSEGALLVRIVVGFALGFAVGFERELRGAPAGDRTFALIGMGSTAITAVALKQSPQAVAGAITGVGFIGAGIVFHGQGQLVRGLTTAASVFATAAVGIVVGSGRLLLGLAAGAIMLIVLELRHTPVLRILDGRRYSHLFRPDIEPPERPPSS